MNWIGGLNGSARLADNALCDGTFSLTYRDLPDGLEAVQRFLLGQGVAVGEVLAFAAQNTVPAALALLSLLQHGHSVAVLPADGGDSGLPVFCRYFLNCLEPDKDALNPGEFLRLAENPAWHPASRLAGDAPKLLMRTSGSTGAPKMAVFTHAKLHGNALNCVRRFGLSEADRVAIPVPLSHMFGLGAAFLPSVAAGAALDLQKGANLLKFIRRETDFQPNVAFMTPAFADTLLQTRKSVRPYRLTVTAGDRFRADRFARYEAAFGPLVQLYGSTELGAVAAGSPDLPLSARQASAGLPMPDVRLRLQSASESGESEGELWCRRDYAFEGYVDLSGQALELGADYADGWFRTKDFARFSPEGYLELLGRSDHSVNRDGLLVFFADLEKTIEALPQVQAVAVVTGAESVRGRRLIACCVPVKNSGLSAAAVRAHCFETLPRRAVPDEIRLQESLPLLANGKIDRVQLQNTLNLS